MTNRTKWRLLQGSAALLAGAITKVVSRRAWSRATGSEPPNNPDDSDTSWVEALGWSVLVAGVAGVAHVLARRGAATVWRTVSDEDVPA